MRRVLWSAGVVTSPDNRFTRYEWIKRNSDDPNLQWWQRVCPRCRKMATHGCGELAMSSPRMPYGKQTVYPFARAVHE